MKALTVLAILLVAGCASPQTPEQQARLMGDLYLCENVEAGEQTEIRKAEIERRGLNCKTRIAERDAAISRVAKEERDREKAYIAIITRKPKIRTIEDKVLADSIDQYNVVRTSGGSFMDLCVYAGMVKAAAAQAKNPEFYRTWNDYHRLDCTLAGVPF